MLAYPAGIAVTREGAIYFADSGDNRIRRVVAGLITTVAGGDGEGPLAGQLSVPTGDGLDNDAHLYIADSGNKCIRKINPDGSTETSRPPPATSPQMDRTSTAQDGNISGA